MSAQVDTPFFNSVEAIDYYANWKIIDGFHHLPFSLFDFMCFDSMADIERAWGDSRLVDFTVDWERLWGNDPGAEDKAANYQVYRYSRIGAANARTIGDFVSLAFDQNVEGEVTPGHHAYRLDSAMVGAPFAKRLIVGFHGDLTAANAAAASLGGGVGTVIAAPPNA